MSLALRNVRLVGGTGELVDVLLKHGVVTAIGSGVPGSASVDLGGRWIMPGLWDEHVHFSQHALTSRRVDLSGAASAREAVALLAAAPLPTGSLPLLGRGFRDGLWPDRPSATLLDESFPIRPVVVVSADLHCCWLNSAAMQSYGIRGDGSGMLREDDAFRLTRAVSVVPEELLDSWVADAAAAVSARGVVGVVDFEMADNLSHWSRRFSQGFASLRVDAGIYREWLPAAVAAGHRIGASIDGSNGLLRVGPLKVITDGSLNTRTACCVDPYPGLTGAGAHGDLTVQPEDLVALLRAATSAGLIPAVHAIGDRANELALDAFDEASCRGRIEHAQLLRAADVSRFAALGVTASMQPEHAVDDRDVADRLWAGRTDRAFVIRGLLDAGATVVFGSDAPVARLDPWVAIAAAVTRTLDERESWHPEQSVSLQQAIACSTRAGTTVSLGQVADLAVLEDDPFAVDPARLATLPVAATLVGGYFTHNAL